MTVSVSIVIVSFNTKELLLGCIASVQETTHHLSYEIIVVDNASSDGSPEAVEQEFKDIRVVRNDENLGFAKASNQAIRLARGKYLLLLNSDTIMKEGTLAGLVSFLEKHPRAAAVGPKVINPDGTLQNKGFCFPSVAYSLIVLFGINRFLPEKLKRRWFPRFYWGEDETREVDYLEGSCLLLRSEVLGKIGLLPEAYFMYFEEAEWCYLAKRHHYGIWYFPDTEIIHLCGASPRADREEIFGRSLILFYERNIGIPRGLVIVMLSLTASLIDLSVSALSGCGERSRKKIRDDMRGRVRLLRGLMGMD